MTGRTAQDAGPGAHKPLRRVMLSPSDTVIIFVVALLLFGPEQLPKVARWLGDAMRSMQNTTHSFMLEMERAASGEPGSSEKLPALPQAEDASSETLEPPEPDEPAP